MDRMLIKEKWNTEHISTDPGMVCRSKFYNLIWFLQSSADIYSFIICCFSCFLFGNHKLLYEQNASHMKCSSKISQ